MPKISVIVPVYNVEHYLNRCIDSILNQTFKDYELILVDDGSPDNCPAICDGYASKYDFIHVIHKENGGRSDARNAGIEYAFTADREWITFIDSDDCVHPQYLEILYYTVIRTKTDIAVCRMCSFNTDKDLDIETPTYNLNRINYKCFNANKFYKQSGYTSFALFSSPCNKIFHKQIFHNNRFPEIEIFEDELLIPRILLESSQFIFIPLCLYFYFKNDDGIMNSSSTCYKMNAYLTVLTDNCEYFYEKGYYCILEKYFKRTAVTILGTKQSISQESAEMSNTIKPFRENLSNMVQKYSKVLPQLGKYGLNEWLKIETNKKNVFKNDIKNLKQEKGLIFAILYWLKHFWKVYF